MTTSNPRTTRAHPRSRRRTTSAGPTIVEGSVSSGGEAHTGPLWLLTTAGIFGIAWFIFSTIQITGTIQTVFMFLLSTITVTPGMTAQDLLKLQQGSLDSTELIANAIGWAVQIVLLIATFPSEHYITAHLGRFRRLVMWVLIGGDLLTDALYVLRGRTIFDAPFHLAPGGLGIMIIALIYPVAVTAITVFCGVELAHRVDRLLSHLRDGMKNIGA